MYESHVNVFTSGLGEKQFPFYGGWVFARVDIRKCSFEMHKILEIVDGVVLGEKDVVTFNLALYTIYTSA